MALVVSLEAPVAHASTKAGTPCKMAGFNVIENGFRFTCTKTGKKLVWSKGVKVARNPVSTPTPTPTATPTPAPTPTPTPTSYQGLVEDIPLNGFDSIFSYQQRQPELGSSSVIVDLSPHANPELASATLNDLKKGFRFWQAFTSPSTKIHMVFADRSDMNWFQETMKTIQLGNTPWLTRIYDLSVSNPLNSYGGSNGSDPQGNALFFFLPGTSTIATSPGWLGVGPHEWTHFAQQAMAGDINRLPCWFKEGQATYFGNAISNNVRDKWLSVWKQQIQTNKYDFQRFYTFSKDDLVNWFDSHALNMPNGVCGPDGAYVIGGLAVEYLVGTIGVSGVYDFEARIKKGEVWTSALAHVSGKSYEKAMLDIAEFVLLQRDWAQ